MMNKDSIGNVGIFLKENNIKPSFQRIKIFEYLLNVKSHPHVDEIYRALISIIPTLSKTTVYNTLNLFIEKGIVDLITIDGNEIRYDVSDKDHGHFKCDICGNIYDFDANILEIDTNLSESFIISQKDLFFRGICAKCNKKN